MSYTTITAHISDQTMQLTNLPNLASGSIGVLRIQCHFCDLWDGYGKSAIFYKDKDTVYHSLIVDDIVTVPHEVLAEAGYFYFGVMGIADNTRTTEVLKISVAQGAITSASAESVEPSPDIYAQILAQYNELSEKVQGFTNPEIADVKGLSEALTGKADSSHNHDSVYAKFIATITTGSCDDILVPLTLRDIRTNNDELYNMFATGGTKGENYAYIITLFLSNVNADASRVQIAVGYTNAYIATRAYYNVTGWKPWNMMMSSILHPYFAGTTLPSDGEENRLYILIP